MRRLALLACLVLPAGACVYVPLQREPQAICPVAGHYAVTGKAPDGSEYTSDVMIVGTSDGCFMRSTATNESYGRGKFLIAGLKVDFVRDGRQAEGFYTRRLGDNLHGEWHYLDAPRQKGVETLKWIKPDKLHVKQKRG